MSGDYIFIASGDSCPICTGLHGMYVDSAGYKPHSSCTCNTVKREDGATCELEAEEDMVYEQRGRPGHFLVNISVTVTCPNGKEAGTAGMVTGTYGNFERNADIVEELACDICENACDSSDDEFLCC